LENKKEPSREYHWASEEELNENLRAKHRQENSCYGKWKTYWKGKHPLEWAVFVFTVGAFFAAAVAALYTKREWATAKAEEINQLRAYVFPSDQPVFSVDGTHQEVDFQIRWRNTGTTETRVQTHNTHQTTAATR
jgi:alpha/beta superfamily hydrolase